MCNFSGSLKVQVAFFLKQKGLDDETKIARYIARIRKNECEFS